MSKRVQVNHSDIERVALAIEQLVLAEGNDLETYYGEASVKLISSNGYIIAYLHFIPEQEEWVANFEEYGTPV